MRVAVNGRFVGRATTGVERYAAELTRRLPDVLDGEVGVLTPREEASGVRGHAWEQLVLPRLARRWGADALASLCNFGPLAVAPQLVVVHDAAPFLAPAGFSRAYRAQARALQPLLARRCRLATVSERSRAQLAAVLRVEEEGIALVPPAVGPPFVAGEEPEGAAGPVCVFVGGHDPRKNLGFLLSFWERLHAAHGLELHVVARSTSASLRRDAAGSPPGGTVGPVPGGMAGSVPGVVWHHDLDDAALARLYRSARCVVSPSRFEGFGLPLLEGLACGTPFLATDAGAARELAVRPEEQLLPLRAADWWERLASWAEHEPRELRRASAAHARRWTWTASARALADALTGLSG